MNDIVATFKDDPAGWTSVILAVLVITLSAVFWRRTWAFLRWVGRLLKTATRLRVTTADRLPSKRRPPIRPVRWDVTKLKDAAEHEFVLANWGEGSVARDVQLEVNSNEVSLRSGAFWDAIDGGQFGRFLMLTSSLAFWIGVTFTVKWTDERGERRSDLVEVRSRD